MSRSDAGGSPLARGVTQLYACSNVPTAYGTLRVLVFREAPSGAGAPPEHVALVMGDVRGRRDVLTRVHSECWTGEVLRSLKCDCREQLEQALRSIARSSFGVILYLRQEGRGIGLGNKIRAYALQESGLDTVDANRVLGFADDLRTYGGAAQILHHLEVRSVRLLTNNPEKIRGLEQHGVRVSARVPMFVPPNSHSVGYLSTKNARMGHRIPEADVASRGAPPVEDER